MISQPEVARIIGVGGCRLIVKIYNNSRHIVLSPPFLSLWRFDIHV